TLLALGIDSVYFAETYFDARQITNFLAIVYFSFFFWFSDAYLRKLMFVMVLLSYVGELIFCTLLGMYDYRTPVIPLYVPFGHAIVYASGSVLAHTEWAVRNDKVLKKYFAIGFSLLFLSVGIFLNDVFSLIFGVCFFLLLKRKKWQNLYYFIALCVIFIELAGTYFQCWKWIPKTFGLIPAVNPPMGAVFFYAGGDVLLVKIVEIWKIKTTIISPVIEE
ncbi:MAG: hypothetical protein KA133_00445, partial [Flavobacterium sp.]|nr:hypothetical protein [Flavobacterium sp.]